MQHTDKAELFPYFAARINLLPPTLLNDLCLHQTTHALEQATAIETGLYQIAESLEDALHTLVPQLTERALRRAALALKRDIHNLRTLSLSELDVASIVRRLPESVSEQVEQWQSALAVRNGWLETARTTLQAELCAANLALVQAMGSAPLQQGLAMASPDFLAALTQGHKVGGDPGNRFARSCFSYLVRATVKTSPLSTFTRIGYGHFDRDTESAVNRNRSVVHVNRALATSLLRACTLHPELARAFRFGHHAGIPQDGSNRGVILSEHGFWSGLFGRVDRVADSRDYGHLLQVAKQVDHATYQECLDLIGTENPHGLFVRLLDLQLIRAVAPWARNSQNPLGKLADALSPMHGEFSQMIARVLSEAAGLSDAITSASGPERLNQIDSIRKLTAEVIRAAGVMVPQWLEEGPVVYEDAGIPHVVPALGDQVRKDMDELAERMRGYVVRHHLYDDLVNHFVQRYGRGGCCTDILEFLCNFIAPEENISLIFDGVREDVKAGSVLNHPNSSRPVGKGSLPPTASVYFQIAAKSLEDVRTGNYLLVVNQSATGDLGVLLRSSGSHECQSEVRECLQSWMRETVVGALSLQLPVYAEWNTLQYRSVPSVDVLEWPSDWLTTGDRASHPIHSLSLVHDPENQTLDLLGPDGIPVALHYLGAIPKHMVIGPLSLLLILANPWFNGNFGLNMARWAGSVTAPSVIEFADRLVDGRIVLRRAAWRIPVAAFPVQQKGEEEFCYLERVHRWRQQHQIPLEVYFNAERASVSYDANLRKPMWLRFDSLHALQAVRTMLTGDVLAIRLEEALPSRQECWVMGEDGMPRAAEFVAMIRWRA